MLSKPIPVPPQGTQLEWRLDHPYTAKHLLAVIGLLALLLWTGHRTEMDRMVAMSVQAAAKIVGLADDSQVVRGLSRVATSMWPPAKKSAPNSARFSGSERNWPRSAPVRPLMRS